MENKQDLDREKIIGIQTKGFLLFLILSVLATCIYS